MVDSDRIPDIGTYVKVFNHECLETLTRGDALRVTGGVEGHDRLHFGTGPDIGPQLQPLEPVL